MNAFGACFAEKLASLYAEGTEARAMVHPGHLRRHAKQDLKLCVPNLALEGKPPPLELPQPIGVEINVPGLVAQDAIASLFEDGIARTPVQQTIVGCPDQLRDHQHLELELQTERTAR